jgi:hypothetical protein
LPPFARKHLGIQLQENLVKENDFLRKNLDDSSSGRNHILLMKGESTVQVGVKALKSVHSPA